MYFSVQATQPSGPVQDEVDTCAALGLAGNVSAFSIEKKEKIYVWFSAFCKMFHTSERELAFVLSQGCLGDQNLGLFG